MTLTFGATFRFTDPDVDNGGHLWIVISDPVVTPVVAVSVTNWEARKEQICIVESNEHPWLRHRSCIAFGFARGFPVSRLTEWFEAGEIVLEAPASAELLHRILDGAAHAPLLAIKLREILRDQGLV